MRVLVVEDEPLLAGAIAEWLRDEAHAVDVAHDGGAALDRLTVNDYDVIVLDRNLPVVHGDDVCRTLVDSGSPGSASARTTTSPSRSPSRNWPPGCTRLAGAAARPRHRCCAGPASPWIPRATKFSATGTTSHCPKRSSRS